MKLVYRILIMGLLLLAFKAGAVTLELDGPLTQGALIRGKTDPGSGWMTSLSGCLPKGTLCWASGVMPSRSMWCAWSARRGMRWSGHCA